MAAYHDALYSFPTDAAPSKNSGLAALKRFGRLFATPFGKFMCASKVCSHSHPPRRLIKMLRSSI